jgi:8-amino-7-oxononanoate synthase
MIDFTSSLYLGLDHPSAVLDPWPALTLGRPAALEDPPGGVGVARSLELLQGLPAATLAPSTLHLFWDLFHLLQRTRRTVLLLDAGAYPILRWAARASCSRRVMTFAHHDAGELAALAERLRRNGQRPVVVTDGYCPGCNRTAPLRAYADVCDAHGGLLVLDDTQALGVLGRNPTASSAFGDGGGGSVRWHALSGRRIVVGASLAKGFGAPLAVLAGPQPLLRRYLAESRTRLHCSPPSVAAIHAARRALNYTAICGALLRERLARLAARLRERLGQAGLAAVGKLPFPVQSFRTRTADDAMRLHRRLFDAGVRALVTAGCDNAIPRLTFIITAKHGERDIDRAGDAIRRFTLAREEVS